MTNIYTIDKIKIGDTVSYQRVITEDDVIKFSELSGDNNEAHLNEEKAKKTIFKSRIAHGMLIGSLFSKIFGTIFPGSGTIYLSQNLEFISPVYLNDDIDVSIEIIKIEKDKNLITAKTICKKNNGEVVVDGEAVLMPPIVK